MLRNLGLRKLKTIFMAILGKNCVGTILVLMGLRVFCMDWLHGGGVAITMSNKTNIFL